MASVRTCDERAYADAYTARVRRALALVGLVLAGAPLAVGARPAPQPLLPDLVQRPPASLVVLPLDEDDGTTHFILAFSSRVENLGRGPMIVRGTRASVAAPTLA